MKHLRPDRPQNGQLYRGVRYEWLDKERAAAEPIRPLVYRESDFRTHPDVSIWLRKNASGSR